MKNNNAQYFFNKCNAFQEKKRKLKEQTKELKYGRVENAPTNKEEKK